MAWVLISLSIVWPSILDSGTTARLAGVWPIVREVAAETQTDPYVLAGMLVVESRVADVVGGRNNQMYGQGQVHWYTWHKLLQDKGVACTKEDLLTSRKGILAAGTVLAELRRLYGPGTKMNRGGECILCTYNSGLRGLDLKDGCGYSRFVLYIRNVLRRAERGVRVADGR